MTLPSTERCDFLYALLDGERSAALLRVTGMMRYREALEMWRSIGSEDREETGRVLRPHHPMTHEKLASYGFDKHAGILLALEVAGTEMDEVRPVE